MILTITALSVLCLFFSPLVKGGQPPPAARPPASKVMTHQPRPKGGALPGSVPGIRNGGGVSGNGPRPKSVVPFTAAKNSGRITKKTKKVAEKLESKVDHDGDASVFIEELDRWYRLGKEVFDYLIENDKIVLNADNNNVCNYQITNDDEYFNFYYDDDTKVTEIVYQCKHSQQCCDGLDCCNGARSVSKIWIASFLPVFIGFFIVRFFFIY